MIKCMSVTAAVFALLLGLANFAAAAKVSVHEYPNRFVVEIDGSMDSRQGPARHPGEAISATPKIAEKTQPQLAPARAGKVVAHGPAGSGPAVAVVAPVSTSIPGPDHGQVSGANATMPNAALTHSAGYASRLQARQADQIAARMAARQERWAKRRAAARPQ